MLSSGSFSLKWETERTKCMFPALKPPPYQRKERSLLARSMSVEQLLGTSVRLEDAETKRKLRWKAMRQLHLVTQAEPFRAHSFSRPLFALGRDLVSADHVVAALVSEYRFPAALRMDALLRWLCWACDSERRDAVDWRDLLLLHEILLRFRWVRDRTADLLLALFDVFCEGSEGPIACKDEFLLRSADEHVLRILLAPCVTESEIAAMKALSEGLFSSLRSRGNVIKRHEFKRLLCSQQNAQVVSEWARLMWEQLPSDLRLTVLDEAQLRHKETFESVVVRFQLEQALALHRRNTQKVFLREWYLYVMRSSGIRLHHSRKIRRRVLRMFQFWRKLSRRMAIRRRRRALATAMGSYALKARCFLRLKLALQNRLKIEAVVGTVHHRARFFHLAGTHLRQYRRLHRLRIFYHRWWNKCVRMNNAEVAADANVRRLLRKTFLPWREYAHAKAEEERAEVQARENKLQMDRLFAQTEEATKELLRLEKEREERQRNAKIEAAKREKALRLEQAKLRMRREREEEREIVLKIQREERMKRVTEELKRLKSTFKREFAQRARDMLAKAKDRTKAYIENPDNQLALDLKFQTLKREFFANPSPETKERERVLSSYRNILFLYIDAKLRADGVELEELLPRFDAGRKGYLNYEEFATMIRSLKTTLSEAQILSIIRAVDSDKSGYIETQELYNAMREIEQMGVPGSPWKLYIDPAEDIICYHNFVTGEKVPEFQMTDQTLRAIVASNLYGEAENSTLQEIKALRVQSWKDTLENYMARRMQYLFRQWKARKWRQKSVWKVEKRALRERTERQRVCVRFMEKHYVGYKSRAKFKKQLQLTIEKVYDVESTQVFYFNHVTQASTWEMPKLLRRHGDVTDPWPWIPLDQVHEDTASPSNGNIPFWHILAKREFPKKPDGYTMCGKCQYLLAIHRCVECQENFCFRCHRSTHSNPLGFTQRTKARKDQYTNADFLVQMKNFTHSWTKVQLLKCQLCKSSKVLAAFFCNNCDKNLCRQCFRRLHPADMENPHNFMGI